MEGMAHALISEATRRREDAQEAQRSADARETQDTSIPTFFQKPIFCN